MSYCSTVIKVRPFTCPDFHVTGRCSAALFADTCCRNSPNLSVKLECKDLQTFMPVRNVRVLLGRFSRNSWLGSTAFCEKSRSYYWGMLLKSDNGFSDWYSSPNIIRVIKSRGMRLVGHVARMGGGELRSGFGGETWGKETTWKTQA